MAEFRHDQHAPITPTKCACCSTHSCDKGFVDTGVELVAYGRLYVCGGCVEQMGQHVEMVQAGVHEKLRRDFKDLLDHVDLLEGELANARPVMKAVEKAASKTKVPA